MALPHYAYGDPAKQVESTELHRLGCKACARSERVLGLALCPNNLKYPACKGNPRDGYLLASEYGGHA